MKKYKYNLIIGNWVKSIRIELESDEETAKKAIENSPYKGMKIHMVIQKLEN